MKLVEKNRLKLVAWKNKDYSPLDYDVGTINKQFISLKKDKNRPL